MSDEIGAGAVDAGGSVDSGSGGGDSGGRIIAEVGMPSEYSAGQAKTVKQFKDAAFDAMARDNSGDATDYIEERRARDAEASGDPSVNTPARKQARAERFQRALEAAERSGDDGGQSESPLAQAHQDAVSESHEADLRAREHETIRAAAQYEMRVAEFARQNPDYLDTVQAILPIWPPSQEVAGALLRSPYGPQLTYELANNIDALEKLNALPPAQALHILAKAEGILMAGEQQQRAPLPPPRRTTKAPAPVKALSGGTSGNFDPSKSDMDAYVAKRKAGWGS